MSPRPEPRVPYISGFPLFDRERNISHATAGMRERAMEIADRRDADGVPLSEEELGPDNMADTLEYWADLVETLFFHGTSSYYDRGCRCSWCKEAARQTRNRFMNKPRIKWRYVEEEDEL